MPDKDNKTLYQYKNEGRYFMVCVDSYEDQLLEGRLRNIALGSERRFGNMMQLILSIEGTLDATEFPQSFTGARRFWKEASADRNPLPAAEGLPKEPPGLLGTFGIKIVFRQNASWQGILTWIEKGRKENFRSVLELMLLLDSALAPR